MKNWEKESEAKLSELLQTIEQHPLTLQVKRQEAAEKLQRRQETAEKIQALKNEQAETLEKLQSDCSNKEILFVRAKEAMEIAAAELNRANQERRAASFNFERQIANYNSILFETADPALDSAIEYFLDKLNWLRSPGRIDSRGRTAERNIFSWKKTVTAESNKDAVLSAMKYCQNAIHELEDMKLEPELDLQRIENMKAGIPGIDTYNELSGERPLDPGPPPAHRLMDETLADRVIEKVNEFLVKPAKRLKTA